MEAKEGTDWFSKSSSNAIHRTSSGKDKTCWIVGLHEAMEQCCKSHWYARLNEAGKMNSITASLAKLDNHLYYLPLVS
jgi:hypothetical protein